MIVEDEDKCKVQNADTVTLSLTVLPPVNNAPEILVNGEVLKDTLFVDAGNLLDLDITGFDRDSDNILLRLHDNREAQSLGVLFDAVEGFSSVFSTFSWQTDCSLLEDRFQSGIYNFPFVLEDDKCLVPLSDRLDLVVVVQDEHIEYDFLPPNVFTPNVQDEINQTYYVPNLPGNNCERQFEKVAIYNRFGVEVFTSGERDFHWTGDNYPSGVYYYLIMFSDFSVKGTVSMLK